MDYELNDDGRVVPVPDWRLRLACFFGDHADLIASIPHLVTPFTEPLINCIAAETGSPLGVWPEAFHPQEDISTLAPYSPGTFCQWKTGSNQDELRSFCEGTRGTYGATILISSSIPNATLEELDHLREVQGVQLDDVDSVRMFFVHHIGAVGWVSLGLDLERNDYLLTLFDSGVSHLRDAIRSALRSRGVDVFTMEDVCRTCEWPPQLLKGTSPEPDARPR